MGISKDLILWIWTDFAKKLKIESMIFAPNVKQF